MNDHPQHVEDFDLYALGALEGEERKSFEAHVAGCAECARRLAEARGRVSLLALAAKPLEPPGAVRDRLMKQVREESDSAQARSSARAAERPAERSGGLFGRWTLAWVAAAAVLGVATGLLWQENRKLNDQIAKTIKEATQAQQKVENSKKIIEILEAPDSMMVSLASLDATQASGKICYNARMGKLACSTHLPVPPSDKSYQLWLVPMAGNPMNAGVFGANMSWTDDMWMADVKPGTLAKAFAVTLEPAGGMPQPTGPKVLVGITPQRVSFSNPKRENQTYSLYEASRGETGHFTANR